jgi:hypothetical protein
MSAQSGHESGTQHDKFLSWLSVMGVTRGGLTPLTETLAEVPAPLQRVPYRIQRVLYRTIFRLLVLSGKSEDWTSPSWHSAV